MLSLLTRRGAHVDLVTLPYIDTTSPFLQPWYRAPFRAARVRHLNRLVELVAGSRAGAVSVVDLNRFLGPDGRYTNRVRGVDDVRGDGIHLSPAGQVLVGQWLDRRLQPTGPRA